MIELASLFRDSLAIAFGIAIWEVFGGYWTGWLAKEIVLWSEVTRCAAPCCSRATS